MATAQPTPQELKAKAASYRKQAEDKSLPQSVRNQFLDNANELEAKASGVKLAKGGAVKKKSISEYGGKEKYASKAAMAKHEKAEGGAMEKKEKAMKKTAGVAIVIGVGKPKAMAKGGMAKKGKC